MDTHINGAGMDGVSTGQRCPLDFWLASACGVHVCSLPEALHREQQKRWAQTLARARQKSPFYREHLRGLPQHLPLSQAPALPFTTAADLVTDRAAWQRFLCVPQGEVERLVTLDTSGTSAAPKRLAFSAADLAATRDFFQAGMAQLVRPGDRVLVLWPGAAHPHGVSALLRQALTHMGVCVLAGEAACSPHSLRQELHTHKPQVLVAAPRQLAALLPLLEDTHFCAGLALRGILSSAEMLDPALRRHLRTRLGLLVLDHYGLTETGYGGGVECTAHHGYHLRELDLWVEVVDVATGLPLPPGQEGEVVITTLSREAMPLIRYRTGDVASLLPGPCACGSPLRRLGAIRGRIVRHGQGYNIENTVKGAFYERTAHAAL